MATTTPETKDRLSPRAGNGISPSPLPPIPARSRWSPRLWRELAVGGLMMLPFAVLLIGLLGWPVVWTVLLSFTNEALTGPTALHRQWIGFGNYIELFQSSDFFGSLWHSVYYLVGSAYVGQVLLGFLLALLLRQTTKTVATLVGGVVILSWVVPEIIAAFMWFALLGAGGVIQQVLGAVGIPYTSLLVSHPMLSVNLANSWRGVAFSMMLFTAALSGVPSDILEAAAIDGASMFQRVIHVVLPAIQGSILVDVVLVTLGTLNNFVLIFTMTGGGPGEDSQVLSTYMYLTGFTEYRIAYGTAVSVVLLLFGVILSVMYVRALRNA